MAATISEALDALRNLLDNPIDDKAQWRTNLFNKAQELLNLYQSPTNSAEVKGSDNPENDVKEKLSALALLQGVSVGARPGQTETLTNGIRRLFTSLQNDLQSSPTLYTPELRHQYIRVLQTDLTLSKTLDSGTTLELIQKQLTELDRAYRDQKTTTSSFEKSLQNLTQQLATERATLENRRSQLERDRSSQQNALQQAKTELKSLDSRFPEGGIDYAYLHLQNPELDNYKTQVNNAQQMITTCERSIAQLNTEIAEIPIQINRLETQHSLQKNELNSKLVSAQQELAQQKLSLKTAWEHYQTVAEHCIRHSAVQDKAPFVTAQKAAKDRLIELTNETQAPTSALTSVPTAQPVTSVTGVPIQSPAIANPVNPSFGDRFRNRLGLGPETQLVTLPNIPLAAPLTIPVARPAPLAMPVASAPDQTMLRTAQQEESKALTQKSQAEQAVLQIPKQLEEAKQQQEQLNKAIQELDSKKTELEAKRAELEQKKSQLEQEERDFQKTRDRLQTATLPPPQISEQITPQKDQRDPVPSWAKQWLEELEAKDKAIDDLARQWQERAQGSALLDLMEHLEKKSPLQDFEAQMQTLLTNIAETETQRKQHAATLAAAQKTETEVPQAEAKAKQELATTTEALRNKTEQRLCKAIEYYAAKSTKTDTDNLQLAQLYSELSHFHAEHNAQGALERAIAAQNAAHYYGILKNRSAVAYALLDAAEAYQASGHANRTRELLLLIGDLPPDKDHDFTKHLAFMSRLSALTPEFAHQSPEHDSLRQNVIKITAALNPKLTNSPTEHYEWVRANLALAEQYRHNDNNTKQAQALLQSVTDSGILTVVPNAGTTASTSTSSSAPDLSLPQKLLQLEHDMLLVQIDAKAKEAEAALKRIQEKVNAPTSNTNQASAAAPLLATEFNNAKTDADKLRIIEVELALTRFAESHQAAINVTMTPANPYQPDESGLLIDIEGQLKTLKLADLKDATTQSQYANQWLALAKRYEALAQASPTDAVNPETKKQQEERHTLLLQKASAAHVQAHEAMTYRHMNLSSGYHETHKVRSEVLAAMQKTDLSERCQGVRELLLRVTQRGNTHTYADTLNNYCQMLQKLAEHPNQLQKTTGLVVADAHELVMELSSKALKDIAKNDPQKKNGQLQAQAVQAHLIQAREHRYNAEQSWTSFGKRSDQDKALRAYQEALESLKATLQDPSLSPEEKIALLRTVASEYGELLARYPTLKDTPAWQNHFQEVARTLLSQVKTLESPVTLPKELKDALSQLSSLAEHLSPETFALHNRNRRQEAALQKEAEEKAAAAATATPVATI